MKRLDFTRFSYTNLFTVSRILRKQPKQIELTPQLRCKLESAYLETGGADAPPVDRPFLRRAQEEWKFQEVMECIRTSTCQYCRREDELISYKIRKVTALVIRHRIGDRTEFACRKCACRRLAASTLQTCMTGWWSPGGLSATPYSIFRNAQTLLLELSRAEMQWVVGAAQSLRSWIDRLNLGKPDIEDAVALPHLALEEGEAECLVPAG
ncbi:hypothetical protein [Lewinella sp. IMCC34191]|uniref:hypothetical protein n=1 Tax=Lewinella sp. IMCC34191 TaxID=2259172 RepID=UPI000E23D20B|nr:hypothetical protein [Lewinella sp. IMCC34191]